MKTIILSPVAAGSALGLRSLKLLSAVAVLGLAVTLSSRANLGIINYSFAGAPGANLGATALNPNASGSTINFGTGLSEAAFTNILAASPVAGATTLALAQSLNTYFQFTVTPAAGYALNLTALSFQASYGWSGATYAVASSADGFASVVDSEGITTLYPTSSLYSVNLSAAAFQAVTSAITFRIYDFNAVHGTGIGPDSVFSSLSLAGTVTSVPEPMTYAMLGVGSLVLLGLRRRPA